MHRDTSEHRFYSTKYLINTNLPNGCYIAMDKKDTVSINNIENNRLNGKQIYFMKNEKTNYRDIINTYINDSLITENIYHLNGNLLFHTEFINGKINGVKKVYYSNGKQRLEEIYKNDSVFQWKTYYENGQLKSEGYGDFMHRQGFLNEYYDTGNLKQKIFFIKGIPIYFTSFYETGIIKATGYIERYEEDVRVGYSNPGYQNRHTNYEKGDVYNFDEKGCYIKPK